MEPGSRDAPTTAIDVGRRIRSTERDSAVAARASMAASASGVGSMPRSTSITPSSKWLEAVNPAWVNTPSILRFWGNTDAVNPEIPASLAAAARYSNKTVAMPRP